MTINDMLMDCPIEEAITKAESTENESFGKYICVNGWFLKEKSSLLRDSYDGFKATDICWVYPRKVGHGFVVLPVPIPIPLGSTFDIACKLSNGTEIIT